MRFLALDFESGGLLPSQKCPVTLGLAIFEDGKLSRSKEWLFEPITDFRGKLKFDYSSAAQEIHGKSLQLMREKGLPYSQVYVEVRNFLRIPWTDAIVSHNAPFDSEVWNTFLWCLSEWDRNYQASVQETELLVGPWYDTKRIAQSRYRVPYDLPDLKLETLARRLDLGEQGEIHGAEKDAILAGQLFIELTKPAEALF